MAHHGLAVVALCALLSSLAATVHAAGDADAEALIHQGVELRKQDHNDLALPLLERAYKMAPSGRTAAQLGLVRLALDDWPGADELLTASLKMGGPWVEKNRPVLEESLQNARSHLGRLMVIGEPDGANVLLDGKTIATLPMKDALKVVEGTRTLVVQAPGFADFTKVLMIHGQQAEVVEVHREAAQPQPGAGAGATAAAPENKSRGRAVLPWAFGAGAVGGLVFGIVEHLRWSQGSKDFNAVTVSGVGGGRAPACAVNAPMRGLDSSCNTLYGRYTNARTLTFVGYGAAAALAATSAVLFVLNAKSHEGEVAYGCAPDFVQRGWQCAVSF